MEMDAVLFAKFNLDLNAPKEISMLHLYAMKSVEMVLTWETTNVMMVTIMMEMDARHTVQQKKVTPVLEVVLQGQTIVLVKKKSIFLRLILTKTTLL